MTYYFLQDDYDDLLARIEDLRGRVKEQYRTCAESAEQSSETWHDNYEHEEGQRQIAMLGQYLQELVEVANTAEIVTPQESDRVEIGRRVTTEDVDSGETRVYTIGSFMCLSGAEKCISYTAPIAEALMEARVGEVREVRVGETIRKVRISNIE
jgi:transcription elongation factor GreA